MPRVLELNPSHAIITKLAARATGGADDLLNDIAHLLFDQARIVEGESPADPTAYAQRLSKIMDRAL